MISRDLHVIATASTIGVPRPRLVAVTLVRTCRTLAFPQQWVAHRDITMVPQVAGAISGRSRRKHRPASAMTAAVSSWQIVRLDDRADALVSGWLPSTRYRGLEPGGLVSSPRAICATDSASPMPAPPGPRPTSDLFLTPRIEDPRSRGYFKPYLEG
jgi:hypothetical protein